MPKKPSKSNLDIVSSVELQGIYLKSSLFDAHVPPEHIIPESSHLKLGYSFAHQFAQPPDFLFCFVDLHLEIKAKENNKLYEQLPAEKVLAKGRCGFIARYKISRNDFTSDALDRFTKINALFNVYPYLREHVDSTMAKMNVHGVMIPLLKPPTKQEMDEAGQEAIK